MVVSPPHSFSSFQGPIICLAPRRGQEDCPHLAALTTTPGTDFDARHRLSQHRPSGPKPLTPRGAAQQTATRGRGRGSERGSENGKEKEKERREIHPLVKKRKIKRGERQINWCLIFIIWEALFRFSKRKKPEIHTSLLLFIQCEFQKSILSLQGFCGSQPPLQPFIPGLCTGQLPDQQPDSLKQPELKRLRSTPQW